MPSISNEIAPITIPIPIADKATLSTVAIALANENDLVAVSAAADAVARPVAADLPAVLVVANVAFVVFAAVFTPNNFLVKLSIAASPFANIPPIPSPVFICLLITSIP